MNLLLRPWRHYADFRGRSRRLEYLLFVISFYVLLFASMFAGHLLLALVGQPLAPMSAPGEGGGVQALRFVPMMLFLLAAAAPAIALSVRRLHDLGISGWWLMIAFVPLIGQILFWLLTFIIVLIPAPRGENQYGFDPRDPEEEDDTALLGDVFS
jgi:uncharacterized membrane protein YhaH (DUF805 family)